MSHFSRLFCTTALSAALLPGLANADVTADDVWQNMQDYMATLGGSNTISASRQGDTISVSESTLAYELPFGIGQLNLDFSGFSITEIGDGTVSVDYSDLVTYGVAVNIKGKGSFSAKLDFTFDEYKTIASGIPGDVTYTWSTNGMNVHARDVKLDRINPPEGGQEEFTMNADGKVADMSGVMRVQVAELVKTQSSYSIGKQETSFGFSLNGDGVAFIGGAQSVEATSNTFLPRNGMDLMNLAAALRDGLSFEVNSKTIGYHTSQVVEEKGEVVSSQTTRVQEQTAKYALDQTSVRVSGTALDGDIEAPPGKDIPFPVKFHLDSARGGMTLPLLASDDLQDVGYNFDLQGLSISGDLWDMVDPQKTLSRDPMVMEMDLAASVLNKVDWLDFMAVKARFDAGEVPIELHEMKLNTLTLDAVGAKLTGSGSGSFDNSDLESFGGFPKPTGVIDLALRGGNGLLDNLVAMGLMSDEDAMGARMATAVFTAPDPDAGEDALKSRLEMTGEGHILANGQRLQ